MFVRAATSQTRMVPAVTQRYFANPAHSCVRLLGFLATGRYRYDASSRDDCSCLLRGAAVPADGAGGGVAARRSGLTHQRMNLAIVCLSGQLWYVESYCLRYLSYSTVILRLFRPCVGFVFPCVSYLFFLTPPVSASGQDLEAASLQRCEVCMACQPLALTGCRGNARTGLCGACPARLRAQRTNADCPVAVSPEEKDDFSS